MFRIKFSTLLLASVILVSSCGFKPLYKKDEAHRNTKTSCSNFKVEITGKEKFDIAGQSAKYKLQDALNQVCINSEKKYLVQMSFEKTKAGVGIQKNTQITRYNLNINSSFKVFEDSVKKPVYSGTSTMVGGFDVSASDYGTYAQEQDTQSRLLTELARDMTLKISSTLLKR